jgi:hypothetical protein
MNPIAVATEAKGARHVVRRAGAIASRYGLTPGRMVRRIERLVDLCVRAGSAPTLPITASALRRHPTAIRRSIDLGTEFAVHGLHHVDHALLPVVEQIERLGLARRILQEHGIDATGFRAPYLRSNDATMHALRENGYTYDSSQAIHWPIPVELANDGYRRLLDFSSSLDAAEHPAVPWIEEGLVRIGCCLPDDESLVERLGPISPDAIAAIWLDAERAAFERGELLTLQIHPERVDACAVGVAAVLDAASARRPSVWVASLGEIATWWLDRTRSTVDVRGATDGTLEIEIVGPAKATLLARGLDVGPAEPWADGWDRVHGTRVTIHARTRPFVGVDPRSPAGLAAFLRQQGYIVEITSDPSTTSVFLDRPTFERTDELPLLRRLDDDRAPLLRLARWPDAARSAIAVTGDVDALTIWDYALRFAGR